MVEGQARTGASIAAIAAKMTEHLMQACAAGCTRILTKKGRHRKTRLCTAACKFWEPQVVDRDVRAGR